MLVAAEKYI